MENKESEKIEFSDEEIEQIKSIIDSKDLISNNEKEEIKPFITLAKTDDVKLGVLFAKCYGSLCMICDSLFDEDNDFRSKITGYLEYYRDNYGADGIHFYVQEIGKVDGGLGTFHYRGKILTRVVMHKMEYLKFIQFFVKIADVED